MDLTCEPKHSGGWISSPVELIGVAAVREYSELSELPEILWSEN